MLGSTSHISIARLLGTDLEPSLPWLGLGCQAFGGTLTPRASTRILEQAREQGILYYDIARSYGFGHAESILGKFIKSHRHQVFVATKVGESPRTLSPIERFLRQRFARLVRASQSHRQIKHPTSKRAPKKPTFQSRRYTVTEVEKSLTNSLRALGTDYVDILHLHSVSNGGLNDDVMAFLNQRRKAGMVRFLGLATSVSETNLILRRYPEFDVVQIRDQAENP